MSGRRPVFQLADELGETWENLSSAEAQHLQGRFALPPLDIVALTVLDHPVLHDPARKLFGAYDGFLGLLSDDEKRQHLDQLEPQASSDDPLYNEARELSRRFQEGLDGIFFGAHEELARLTRIYGVF